MIRFSVFATCAALAFAMPASATTHSIAIDHKGNRFTATYAATPEVRTRQVGMAAGTRMSTERCIWTADIAVERRIGGSAAPEAARRLPSTKRLSGSVPGACRSASPSIDREIAARAEDITTHLERVAQRDQQQILGELETLTGPSDR